MRAQHTPKQTHIQYTCVLSRFTRSLMLNGVGDRRYQEIQNVRGSRVKVNYLEKIRAISFLTLSMHVITFYYFK